MSKAFTKQSGMTRTTTPRTTTQQKKLHTGSSRGPNDLRIYRIPVDRRGVVPKTSGCRGVREQNSPIDGRSLRRRKYSASTGPGRVPPSWRTECACEPREGAGGSAEAASLANQDQRVVTGECDTLAARLAQSAHIGAERLAPSTSDQILR